MCAENIPKDGPMPQVKEERTGWRDLELSRRHRRWGWDTPAVDLDFLFLEYDKGQPVALVEYKNERAIPQYITHPTLQAIINLGNRAGIPVFGVRYASDFSWWTITPLNEIAKIATPIRLERATEREWVTLLYKLRGYIPPDSLWSDLGVSV